MSKQLIQASSLQRLLLLSVLLSLYATTSFAGTPSLAEHIEVSSFYGKYDISMKKSGQQALSLRGPKIEPWQPPQKADRSYRIGVAFPHLKDSYWLAVNYGIVDEAKNLGVSVALVEAGGYTELSTQQQQLRDLQAKGVDGIILGSISYSANNDLVADIIAQGTPVIEVINDIEAPTIKAKALVSFYDMGFYAGEFVNDSVESSGKQSVSILFLPGPQGSGWADETLEGFKAATEFSATPIDIVDVMWGDTGNVAQAALLEKGLLQNPKVDFIVGNAVAADAATVVLAEKGLTAKVVSTYITPPVWDKIKTGRIAASPADMTVDQARIAIGMMVRLLNGEKPGEDFPFRAGPMIPVITADNLDQYSFDRLFGPRHFKPVFAMEP